MTAPAGATDRAALATWVLLRLTGVVLSMLVLGHFALTHIVNDVADTDAAYVADRLGDVLFITWDAVMLLTAILHGAAGIWIILGEHGGPRTTTWRRLTVAASALMAIAGCAVLIVAG